MITPVLSVNNGVALLPTGHGQSKPFRDWSFPHRYSYSLIVFQLQTKWQLRWQLISVLLHADMMHGVLARQHGLEVLEQNRIIHRWIVEVIDH